jgi:tetratricopeptide (TPR) repeat protein
VIDIFKANPPRKDIDKLYEKMAYFYQADCVYDLGQYAQAIKLYDEAAFRYQNDSSALAALVQIVNAYVALGRTEEARAANERAKWMLLRMSRETPGSGGMAMSLDGYGDWFQWTTQSGLWKN